MIHDRPANDVIPDECYENTSTDINEYRALVAESTTAAAELRLLVQSVRELLAGASDATPLVDALVEAETTVGDRVFLQVGRPDLHLLHSVAGLPVCCRPAFFEVSIPMPDVIMKLLIVAILPASQVVSADVLVLKNGDRISGEISRIWDSEVSIEPEYADEFSVDLSAVDHIESGRDFEIELDDGTKIVGQLAGADSDGRQILNTESDSVSVGLEELFELDEPEKAFDWGGNIEFSAALNSGNTESYNTKLRADGTVRFNDHRHIGEVTNFKEELDGDVTQEHDLFKYNYNWLFRDPWFFSAQLTFERDPIIELDSRVIVSAGLGWDIWVTPRRNLSVQIGVGSQFEEIADKSQESGVWIWSLRYRQDFFGDDLELYHNNSIASNFSGRANTSYKTTTGLRFEITDLLYANLSLDYDYETDPVNFAENEDVALLIGLGAEF